MKHLNKVICGMALAVCMAGSLACYSVPEGKGQGRRNVPGPASDSATSADTTDAALNVIGASNLVTLEVSGLGTPSIPIAAGSGFVHAGIGTAHGPDSFSLNVPGAVAQALLYWSGEHRSVAGDDTIDADFDGNAQSVTGDLIGGPTHFYTFNGRVYVSTYRADVTAFVQSGVNNIAISGMDFDATNLGAGVLVIYDDGSSAHLDLRDGQDLAYARFSPPLDATVPQTFVFAPSGFARVANLHMFISNVGVDRPNRIRVQVEGEAAVDLDNLLNSVDGEEWDSLVLPVNIPAGAGNVTVEIISLEDGSDVLPASLNWMVAGLSLGEPFCGDGNPDDGEECDDGNNEAGDGCSPECTVEEPEPFCGDGNLDDGEECDDGNNEAGDGCSPDCTIEEQGDEGCTPGYWRQPHHYDSWVGYTPDQLFDSVFGVDAPGNMTLGDAVKVGGGGAYALMRHAVAALLNSTSSINYAYETADVIDMVQDAFASGDYEDVKDALEEENERGCPLN